MKKNNFKSTDFWLLLLVLFIGLILRLYQLKAPLADYHSWRQVDTAAVARNFLKTGFDIMHPKYDDLSNIQSGRENPQGLRMVEFPIYNATFALLTKVFPFFSLEVWGRLTSIIFSLIIISIIYYLALKEVGRVAAFFASFVYAVMPFFVFFSRVVLPETTALAFSLMAIYFLYQHFNTKNKLAKSFLIILGIVSFAGALLIKPTTIFFGLVLFYLFARPYKWSVFKKLDFYIFFLLSAFPLLFWRHYIQSFPEGIPSSEWLLTSVNTSQGLQRIFFRPAFFRWIFFERINNLILGGYLTIFVLIGVLTITGNFFPQILLLSSLIYLFVFQGGNVQHEYYQTLILPTLAFLTGTGIQVIIENIKKLYRPILVYLAIFFIFILSWFFSYYRVKDFYAYSPDLPQIVKVISSLTKEGDKIITDTTGDTTLLYLVNRRGAPAPFKEFSELKKDGYLYFVTFNQDVIKGMKLKNELTIVFENDKFALFKL